MRTFLLKTEPSEYSFDDLIRDRATTWTGVANPAALAHLRSARKNDYAFIYHTADQRAIVGLARFTSNPYEDPDKPGRTETGLPRFAVIDLKPVKWATLPVPLAALKADTRFADFALIKQSRLSVMPVPPELDAAIRAMAGL